MENMTQKRAKEITGGLSSPSKMPAFGYSVPAAACKVGGKLRQVKESTCFHCYAFEGNYRRFKNVRDALEYRLASLTNPQWVQAMVVLINHQETKGHGFFRWHDAGDIQSMDHLLNIIKVAIATPLVKHWLPTREYGLIRQYIKLYGVDALPENLNVRVSSPLVDKYQIGFVKEGLTVSGVHSSDASGQGLTCPAPTQDNQCKDCRACWSKAVDIVSYHIH
jgi:hypothetical protein